MKNIHYVFNGKKIQRMTSSYRGITLPVNSSAEHPFWLAGRILTSFPDFIFILFWSNDWPILKLALCIWVCRVCVGIVPFIIIHISVGMY